MKNTIVITIFIFHSIFLVKCFSQENRKNEIQGTIWIEMKDTVPISTEYSECRYIFQKNSNALYINCFEGDTIYCEYVFKEDTLIINHISSSYDKDFPVLSKHRLKSYRIFYYQKNDSILLPLLMENTWLGYLRRTPINNNHYLKRLN